MYRIDDRIDVFEGTDNNKNYDYYYLLKVGNKYNFSLKYVMVVMM